MAKRVCRLCHLWNGIKIIQTKPRWKLYMAKENATKCTKKSWADLAFPIEMSAQKEINFITWSFSYPSSSRDHMKKFVLNGYFWKKLTCSCWRIKENPKYLVNSVSVSLFDSWMDYNHKRVTSPCFPGIKL